MAELVAPKQRVSELPPSAQRTGVEASSLSYPSLQEIMRGNHGGWVLQTRLKIEGLQALTKVLGLP